MFDKKDRKELPGVEGRVARRSYIFVAKRVSSCRKCWLSVRILLTNPEDGFFYDNC